MRRHNFIWDGETYACTHCGQGIDAIDENSECPPKEIQPKSEFDFEIERTVKADRESRISMMFEARGISLSDLKAWIKDVVAE
jgi:hypothetical protein